MAAYRWVVKPLTDREAVLFCVAFDNALDVADPRDAAREARARVRKLRELACDDQLDDETRLMVSQIVEPPPALFCWDGAKPTFKRVGPVEICERCQQSPADHFGTRPKSG